MPDAVQSEVAPVKVDPEKFAAQLGGASAPSDEPAPGACGNQPNGGPYVPADPSTAATDRRAMADLTKRWPVGTELLVFFLNGNGDPWGQTVQNAVRELAPTWSDYANITFGFTTDPTAHITINLAPSLGTGYWCFLGKDCIDAIRRGQQAMNLAFDPSWARADARARQNEFSRVILHEFGHALAFVHEHMRPDRPIIWNERALKGQFGGPPNSWSDAMIKAQITSFYQPTGGAASLLAGGFDLNSIMMYQFGHGLATYDDGRPFETPNNFVLTPLDKVVANMLYHATGLSDPDEEALAPGESAQDGSIKTPGQVVRYSFRPASGKVHVIETKGSTPLLVSLLGKRKDPAGRMLATEGANARLMFLPKNPNQDYFIEVRHAKPMKGTGRFSISISEQS